jgi:hypothetical protein
LDGVARRIDVLANTWLRDLEAQAKALEHDSHELRLLAVAPTSSHHARQMIVRCDSRLTEINVKIEAQKQALTFATSNATPVSKIVQEIRQLSERRTNLEKLSNELKARDIEADESGRTKQRSNAPDTSMDALAIEQRDLQRSRATTRQAGTPKRHRKQRIKSTAERVREQRLFAAIEQGNRGLEYCMDVKAQGVTTRATWRSDGCPKEYPDAYSHRNPRWRALIQKEKNRHTRKMRKR